METSTLPREYQKLLVQKKKAEELLRLFVIKNTDFMQHGSDLKEMAKLGIKGGPRDLSSRLDFYLYQGRQ